MKRILLDSGILSDHVNRRRGIPDKLREHTSKGMRVGTCVPVLAEIVAGIECSQSRDLSCFRVFGVFRGSLLVTEDDFARAACVAKVMVST